MAAHVHENTIYLLESDRKNDGVTVRVCKQVADVYGITLGQIFGEPGAEHVPPEISPIVDLLQPLDMEARLSFIRNVVSNARFMGQLLSAAETRRDVEHATNTSGMLYHPPTQKTDDLADAITGAGEARAEGSNAESKGRAAAKRQKDLPR